MTATIDVRSLAAFKRFLALPGATVTVIRHTWVDNPPPNSSWAEPGKRAEIMAPRTVAKLQGNSVKWSTGGWTYFDKTSNGRGAAGFRFEGETVTMDVSKDQSFSAVCVYQLSLARNFDTDAKAIALRGFGFIVGERDPSINTNHPGAWMVVEAHEASDLPTKDGRDGPWCIVGDDLASLVDEAFQVWGEEIKDAAAG